MGATGHQGGATARYLLEAGAKVHALTRDPLSESARRLKDQGVSVFKIRDFDDLDAILKAAQGCKGVFLNLWPGLDEGTYARSIVRTCKEAGIEIVVASTAFWAGNPEKWDQERDPVLLEYFNSKAAIEKAARDAELKYTILRPSYIHYNYIAPWSLAACPELWETGELVHAFEEGVKVPHIDGSDIGKYAASALRDPDRFSGKEINLGLENPTAEETCVILSRVTGRDIKARRRTPEEQAQNKTPFQMFQLWTNRVDISIDGEALQLKYGIRLGPLEEYLQREKDRFLAGLPAGK
ncbi:hypothetical protein DL766_006997 [Monosporascus sp. MC13-8B]|uniref:NmrA-like domain-containing protein n=1 Tax=Monosporascus cannonballus TaxID=155416 RepID=A0ABY0HCB5_9PEZI|nr:hypothetical protein DL763_008046 [Monosporascus cannonballus]RYO87048.1 hypothetical protein DL762_004473 [Monosporascus cannonballus]RYP25601.1 hypothetical protein DL766_006997 [Monosporascus sp. MC13-8B]